MHNAVQLPDGTWVWRHQQHVTADRPAPELGNLWEQLGSLTMPVTLVRGMATGSVVDDADEAELLRRLPEAQVVRVDGAGHSVQGDQPVVLADILERVCF